MKPSSRDGSWFSISLQHLGWILEEFNAAMHDARRMDTNYFGEVPDVCRMQQIDPPLGLTTSDLFEIVSLWILFACYYHSGPFISAYC